MGRAGILSVLVASYALVFAALATDARADGGLFFDASSANTWDYTTANWWQQNGDHAQVWTDGSDACFQGVAGTVTVADTIASVNSITFGVDGYTLAGGTIALTGPIGSIATTDNGAATVNSVLAGSVGLTKMGTGTLTLGGANTFTGDTYLNDGGAIRLTNANALQNSTFQGGGALSFGTLTTATLGGLGGAGNLALTNENGEAVALSVGNNNESTYYSGVLSGKGSLVKVGSGTSTIFGSNSYHGETRIQTGTLAVDGSAATGFSPSIDVQSGATLDASVGGFALGSSQTLKGSGTVLGGVVAAAGSHIAPGDGIGTLTLAGDLTLNTGALLDFELGAPSNSDLLSMPDSILHVNDLCICEFDFTATDGFGPGTYTLIEAGTIDGTLYCDRSGTINGLPACLCICDGHDLILTVAPEPGTLILLLVAGIGWAVCGLRAAKVVVLRGDERT
jgi:autotransporter-associated beta strand protein